MPTGVYKRSTFKEVYDACLLLDKYCYTAGELSKYREGWDDRRVAETSHAHVGTVRKIRVSVFGSSKPKEKKSRHRSAVQQPLPLPTNNPEPNAEAVLAALAKLLGVNKP